MMITNDVWVMNPRFVVLCKEYHIAYGSSGAID